MTKSPILLVGAGRMGGALLQGWIAKGLGPVIVVEPTPSPALKALARRHRIAIFSGIAPLTSLQVRAAVIALKRATGK